MNSCTLCKANTSTPFNFLLPCCQCPAFWHHRCHKPPVSDKELIDIIKLYNLHKQRGDKKPSFIWTCGTCAAKLVPQPPAVPPSRSTAHNPIIILDSDDDSDLPVVVQPQPTKSLALKSTKKVSSSKTIAKSTNVPPQTASKVSQPPPPLPRSHTVETRRDSGVRIIDDPFIDLAPPAPPQPLRAHASATSSTSASLSAGLGSLHMSTAQKASHTSTKSSLIQQQQENEWDLEYVTPPPPPPALDRLMPPPPAHNSSSQSQRHVRIAQSLPPIAAWISRDDDDEEEEELEQERNEEEDEEDEIEMDEIDATPTPTPTRPVLLPVSISQHFELPPPSNAPRKPFSRKFKAQNLTALKSSNPNSTSRDSRLSPFFFNAEQWMREKKRNLPEYPSGVA